MQKRAKFWAALAGGFCGLAALGSPALAQNLPNLPKNEPSAFLSGAPAPQQPDFPDAGPAVAAEPASPFSFQDERQANAFTDGPNSPRNLSDLWFGFEAIGGYARRQHLNVPLVTTAANPNVANSVGAIGQTGTTVLYGDNNIIDNRILPGGRFSVVMTPPHWLAMELSVFYINQAGNDFAANSNTLGTPLLARPVFATQPGVNSETVFLSSYPGLANGSVDITSYTRMWGVNYDFVLFRSCDDNACANYWCQYDFLAGVRYIHLTEGIGIHSTTTPTDPRFAVFFNGQNFGVGNSTSVSDQFRTINQFRGGEIAGRLYWNKGAWFASLNTKVGLGSIAQVIDITGTTTLVSPNGSANTVNSGMLAVGSNSGRISRSHLGGLLDETLNLGVDLSSCLRIQVGYNAMVLTNVVRPNSLINRNVDTRQVPTDLTFTPHTQTTSPSVDFNTTTFWLQSLNLGLTLTF